MRADKLTRYHRHLLTMAATFSKDRSSQVAALFLDPEDYTELACGYNGMPRGCNDNLEERHERPLKYDYAEHAERNAIFNLARPLLRGAYVVSDEPLSMANARALISVGVGEVWSIAPQPEDATFERIRSFFEETGVRFYHCPQAATLPLEQWLRLAPNVQGVPFSEASQVNRHLRKIHQNLVVLRSLASTLAKDPHAHATVFLAPGEYTRISSGYSGMPRGADDTQTHRYESQERQFWVEDSIRNAIYNKVRPSLKGAAAVVTHIPCAECARAMAAVGIRVIASPAPDADFLSRWSDQVARTRQAFEELNITYLELPAQAGAQPGH